MRPPHFQDLAHQAAMDLQDAIAQLKRRLRPSAPLTTSRTFDDAVSQRIIVTSKESGFQVQLSQCAGSMRLWSQYFDGTLRPVFSDIEEQELGPGLKWPPAELKRMAEKLCIDPYEASRSILM